MDLDLTEDQQTIRRAVAEIAGKFDNHYWSERDREHQFPTAFYDTLASGGWLGVTTAEKYGGLVTMCCGGGLGTGTLLQRVS